VAVGNFLLCIARALRFVGRDPVPFMESAMTDKKLRVEIAHGAFDNFEGTQEELDELMAAIQKMAEDGTLFQNSTPVSDEEAEAAWRRIEEAAKRQ
jgi:hypothetical protein